jgi:allantoicase
MFIAILFFFPAVFASLRGIMQYEINRMTQQRIDFIIIEIAKSNSFWATSICKNDIFYYELNHEHILKIENIFLNRSIIFTDDSNCKTIVAEL